jgi:hypothetical protein
MLCFALRQLLERGCQTIALRLHILRGGSNWRSNENQTLLDACSFFAEKNVCLASSACAFWTWTFRSALEAASWSADASASEHCDNTFV